MTVSNYDIFLSYSRADAAAAEKLRTRLTETGLRAFLDRYALPAGQPWQPQLEAALAGCRALVVLLGPSGLGEWQQREIQLGVDRQATAGTKAPFSLIPVLLPGLQKDDVPLGRFLGLNTWVDLRRGLDDPEALQRLVAGAQGLAIDDGATEKLLAGLSPYRGLLPFREQDAGLFFGRKRFVDELVAKVRQRTPNNTVAVVGRSGSGKSSIVYAGLFPALRQEMGVGQQAVWDIVSLRPLAEPLSQLARTFAPPPEGLDPIAARDMLNEHAERFRKGKVTVAQLVRDRLQAETGSTRLLLYVDQWEELYTQGQPRGIKTEEDRRRASDATLFVDLLLDAAASAPCTLVLTVRSDFYPDLQNHDALRAAVQNNQVSLGPMSQAELQAAIEGPAKALGARVHPDLTARLIRDIGLDVTTPGRDQYDIGKLPLLEYALEQAWTKRVGPEIGLGQYAGLEQALEERANRLYERLSPAQQVAAKRLFVSLVTPGEGREDTRARITLPSDSSTLAVVETFAGTEARLIVTGDAAGSRSAEVSHEALIRHWEKLRAWIDENRDKLRIRGALMAARAEWLKHERHPSLLVEPGLRLEAARQLRDQPGDVVIDEVKDYIEASLARDARRRLWRTGGFAAVAAIAVVMAGLAWVALNLKERAEAQSKIADKSFKLSLTNATTLAAKASDYVENGHDLTKAIIELLNLAAGALRDLDQIKSTPDIGREQVNLLLAVHDAFMNLGDTQQALEKAQLAKAAAQQLVELEPANSDFQSLLYSSCFRVGDALLEQKKMEEAGIEYNISKVIAEQQAARDTSNDKWHKNLQFIYDKIGDLFKEQSILDRAYGEYTKALEIENRFIIVSPDDRDWRRRLAATYNRIGQVFSEQDQTIKAREQYEKALEITSALAKLEPDNLGFQYTLSVRRSRMGMTLRKLGNLAGALQEFEAAIKIRQRLVTMDRSNTAYLNLLASSHGEIANALMEQPDLTGAVGHYRSAIKIREELVVKDQNNLSWWSLLASNHSEIAEALMVQGDLNGAVDHYQLAVAIREKLVSKDPGSLRWQRLLTTARRKLESALAERDKTKLETASERN